MNGKKGSIKIDIPSTANAVPPELVRKSGSVEASPSPRKWIRDVWALAIEDTNRVKFSLKVGLAVLLVSLLELFQAPYQVFNTNLIWSIFTVVIMFEYTVGATFGRGFNRALGSLFAGLFAIVVIQVAISSGRIAEPYIIGVSILFVGTLTTFMKMWPPLVPYEYGFRVSLFTYCMIIISGYRMGNLMMTVVDRLYAISIGGIVAVLVNVLIFPIWAGDKLHIELVKSFNAVADSLQECVKKYVSDDGSDRPEFLKTVMDDFPDEPAFCKFRATMNSSAKFDSLAGSAKWEPPHGRFRQFFYPWSEYVKVAAVLRHCAYEVMALHGCLHSEIQAPYNLRCAFQSEILDAATQTAELLRSLGKDISNMKRVLQTVQLKRVHSSTERLQRSIDMHSYLLTSIDEFYDSPAKPPAKLPRTLSTLKDFSGQLIEPGGLNAEPNDPNVAPVQAESYQGTTKKQHRRLYSWPSIEVDEFDEDGGSEAEQNPRMRALESTAALSLSTFTSLLIEFVARLDHLVDATDELARIARFKE